MYVYIHALFVRVMPTVRNYPGRYGSIPWFSRNSSRRTNSLPTEEPIHTHRIHGAAIYGNIYHKYIPNFSIYTSTMDPMGYQKPYGC